MGYMTDLYNAKRRGDDKEVLRLNKMHEEEKRNEKRKVDNIRHMKIYGLKLEDIEGLSNEWVETFLEIAECNEHGKTIMLGFAVDYSGGSVCLECIKELCEKINIEKVKGNLKDDEVSL